MTGTSEALAPDTREESFVDMTHEQSSFDQIAGGFGTLAAAHTLCWPGHQCCTSQTLLHILRRDVTAIFVGIYLVTYQRLAPRCARVLIWELS